MRRSERADEAIPVTIAGLAEGRCGLAPWRRWELRQPADSQGRPFSSPARPLPQRIFPAAKGKSARTPSPTRTARASGGGLCAAEQELVRYCASESGCGL